MRTDFGGRSCSAKRTTIVHGTLKGCQNDCAVVPREPRDQHFRLESRNTFRAQPGGTDDLPANQRLGAVERGQLSTRLPRTETAEVNPKLVSGFSRFWEQLDSANRPGAQTYAFEV